MKIFYLISTLLMTIQFTSAQSEPYPYPQYKQLVQSIYHQVGDLTASSDLFGVTNFVALYSSPTKYETNAMAFIGDKANSDECKMVVIYSLQKLPMDAYVRFERNLLHLAQDGRLSKSFLNRPCFQDLSGAQSFN